MGEGGYENFGWRLVLVETLQSHDDITSMSEEGHEDSRSRLVLAEDSYSLVHDSLWQNLWDRTNKWHLWPKGGQTRMPLTLARDLRFDQLMIQDGGWYRFEFRQNALFCRLLCVIECCKLHFAECSERLVLLTALIRGLRCIRPLLFTSDFTIFSIWEHAWCAHYSYWEGQSWNGHASSWEGETFAFVL